MQALHQELKEFIIETMNLEDMTPGDIADDTPLFADDGLGQWAGQRIGPGLFAQFLQPRSQQLPGRGHGHRSVFRLHVQKSLAIGFGDALRQGTKPGCPVHLQTGDGG